MTLNLRKSYNLHKQTAAMIIQTVPNCLSTTEYTIITISYLNSIRQMLNFCPLSHYVIQWACAQWRVNKQPQVMVDPMTQSFL